MMEIVYAPLVLSCVIKSLVFGILFCIAFPSVEARMTASAPAAGLSRRLGLALMGGGLFGLAHLTFACASDGFPPRIIQSTGIALMLCAMLGALVLVKLKKSMAKV